MILINIQAQHIKQSLRHIIRIYPYMNPKKSAFLKGQQGICSPRYLAIANLSSFSPVNENFQINDCEG